MEDKLTKILRGYGIVGYAKASSVKFNSFVYTARTISAGLARFCRPLFHSADGDRENVSTKGSATLLSVDDAHFFAVVTKHQYVLLNPEEVSFPGNADRAIACGGQFFVPNKSESYGDELCYLNLSDHVAGSTLNRSDFLPLVPNNCCTAGDDVGHGVSYGYAFDDLEFDYDETGEYDYRMLAMHMKLREYNVQYEGESFDDTLCKWMRGDGGIAELSGFSGGPTFAIVNTSEGFVAKLAGINMSSNGQVLHTVKVDTIKRYLAEICCNL